MSSFNMGGTGSSSIHSGRGRIYGNPNPPYDVHEGEGDIPNGYILVANPGSPVPADYVARYQLAEKIRPADGQETQAPRSTVNNEPLVMLDSGRAVAEAIAPEHLRSDRAKQAGKANAPQQAGKAGAPQGGDRPGGNVIEAGTTGQAPAASTFGKPGDAPKGK